MYFALLYICIGVVVTRFFRYLDYKMDLYIDDWKSGGFILFYVLIWPIIALIIGGILLSAVVKHLVTK